jgi:hypothetical protein
LDLVSKSNKYEKIDFKILGVRLARASRIASKIICLENSFFSKFTYYQGYTDLKEAATLQCIS